MCSKMSVNSKSQVAHVYMSHSMTLSDHNPNFRRCTSTVHRQQKNVFIPVILKLTKIFNDLESIRHFQG